jgi:hypothetical protein
MIGDGPMPGRYIVWLLTVTYVLARGGHDQGKRGSEEEHVRVRMRPEHETTQN